MNDSHSLVIVMVFEIIGILVLDVVAGVNDELGKLTVIFMTGILLGWLLLHYSTLAGWINKGASGSSKSSSGGLLFA